MVRRALTDVDRLLRYSAHQAVETLTAEHEPVHPRELAARVVYKHLHVTGVRTRVGDLIVELADYIRELRAAEPERA